MTDQEASATTTETGDYKPKNIFLTGGAGKSVCRNTQAIINDDGFGIRL